LTQIVKGHLFTWHIKPRMVNKKNLCLSDLLIVCVVKN
jgi:hypothetical protein